MRLAAGLAGPAGGRIDRERAHGTPQAGGVSRLGTEEVVLSVGQRRDERRREWQRRGPRADAGHERGHHPVQAQEHAHGDAVTAPRDTGAQRPQQRDPDEGGLRETNPDAARSGRGQVRRDRAAARATVGAEVRRNCVIVGAAAS